MRLRLSLLKNLLNLLKSGKRHKYVCPKTGLEASTPPERCKRCIKYIEKSSKEKILFVPADKYLLEFAARFKLKRE